MNFHRKKFPKVNLHINYKNLLAQKTKEEIRDIKDKYFRSFIRFNKKIKKEYDPMLDAVLWKGETISISPHVAFKVSINSYDYDQPKVVFTYIFNKSSRYFTKALTKRMNLEEFTTFKSLVLLSEEYLKREYSVYSEYRRQTLKEKLLKEFIFEDFEDLTESIIEEL